MSQFKPSNLNLELQSNSAINLCLILQRKLGRERLRLCHLSAQIQEVFTVSRLNELSSFHETVEQAVVSL